MKSKMKFFKNLATAGIIVAVIILSTDSSLAQRAYLTENFAVSDNAKIEVETSGGSIELVGENTDEVRVEMYVRKRGREIDRDDTDLDDWDIKIEKEGNTVYAIAKREGRSWGNNNLSISFKVFAPTKSIGNLSTSGGSIRLENLIGDQTARTSGGSINAENIGGDIKLKTSGGSITLSDIEGYAEVNTSGGRIRAEKITGGIDARTSGGSITLDGISGNVEAKTSGGSIDAEVLNPDQFIELRTSGGSISVTIPKDKGYDLDLGGNRVRADLHNFQGEFDKNDMEGTMNGGGTKLRARTSGGSVNLRYL
tara:strand:+ start:53118 stop:54047 length:930 start_codon:yes stop_codon:yes gene_type:complete